MADVNTDIYKLIQPSGNPTDALANVGKLADVAGNVMVGRAVQQGMDPATGQIDPATVGNLLRQSPVGAMKAIPTMNALQQLRSAGYAADQAALDTFQKRMAVTYHLFSGLASKTNPTMDDVHDIAAQALDPALNAKQYGITLPVIMSTIKLFRGLSPAQIRQKALQIQTQAATTSEILSEHNPRYQVVDQGGQLTVVPVGTGQNPAIGTTVPKTLPPTTVVPSTQGAHYLGAQPPVPGGGAIDGTGRPIIPVTSAPLPAPGSAEPTGPAAGLRPGYEAAAAATAGQAANAGVELMKANDSSMVRKGMLGNLEEDLQHFTSGPGADWTKVAKAWTNRNLPVPESWQKEGGVLDLKSVASQEQFVKQAQMLAQQQFQAIGGTGTDAKFNSAFTTNPNDYLSQLGNQGIIRLLKGNEDALQAKAAAWQKYEAVHGPDSYFQFSSGFNSHFDPRAFQFKYLSPKDRQAYIDHMAPQDRSRFLHDLTYARKAGWINFGG